MDSSSRATYFATMKTVPVPRLPPEVTDKIIHIVDWEDLLSCALVCTQWLPASRYQLFCDMRVGLPSSYERLVANVLRSERMKEHLSFVRNLLIWHRREPEHTVQEHKSDPRVSFFHIFAGHLPNLTVLVLRHLDWDRCPPHPSMPLFILRLHQHIGASRLQLSFFQSPPSHLDRPSISRLSHDGSGFMAAAI